MTQLLGHPWWLLTLAVVGALAIAGVIVSLFFALGRRPQRHVLTDAPPVDSKDFLLGVSGTINAPLQKGGSARLLNNGDQIFPALLRAINEARHNINFSAYIWEPGRASDQVLEALTRRAREGIEVRVLLDGIGGMAAPDDKFKLLSEAGGKVQWFRTFSFGKITRFHKRNHRRAIVIDGRIGFTGGAAVADKWLGDARHPEEWRDMMVEVRGCLGSNLQSAFAQLWSSVCGEILIGPEFYPHDEEAQETEGGEKLSSHVNVVSSPAAETHPLRKFFWTTFRCARERLYLTTPYFVPDRDTREVVAERARAGVDVRILLPNNLTDAKPIRLAGHSYFQELLEAGVRIYEYQPTFIHSKSLVVDGKWTVVGSANMDIRSKELNQENVIGILDDEFGAEMERTFLDDISKAKEIKLEEWKRRGILHRIGERVCVLFAEQY